MSQHSRANLSAFKTKYSTEDELGIDLTKIPPKRKRKTATEKVCQGGDSNKKGSLFPVSKEGQKPSTSRYQYTAESGSFSSEFPDDYEKYLKGIIGLPAYLTVTAGKDVFLTLDFNKEKAVLEKKPQLIFRYRNAFACTCDDTRRSFVENLSWDAKEDIDELYPPCIHARLIKDIYSNTLLDKEVDNDGGDYQDHEYSKSKIDITLSADSAVNNNEIFEIPFLEDHFIVSCEQSFSVVKATFGQLTCCFCKKKTNCVHTSHINALLKKYEDSSLQMPEILETLVYNVQNHQKRESYHLKCYSYRKTPFHLAAEQRIHIKNPVSNFESQDGVLQFYVDVQECPECGVQLPDNGVMEPVSILFTKYEQFKVQAFSKMCCNCQLIVHYDGRNDCIINMGQYLVHYEVIRDFMFQYLLSRSTMFSFYKVWEQHQTDGGNDDFSKLFAYNYFRQTWYCYLHLLDIDYEEGFVCNQPTCGRSPKMLIMDGTSLGFQRQFWNRPASSFQNEKKLKGSKHQDRVFISYKPLRDMVYRFCNAKAKYLYDEFLQMKTMAEKHQPALSSFLKYAQDIDCTQSCPDDYVELIRMLACNSPVSAGFPLPYIHLIDSVISGTFIEDGILMKELQLKIPILFNLLCKIRYTPVFLVDILKCICQITRRTYTDTGAHVTSTDFVPDALSYFPNLPELCQRGHYVMDKTKTEKICTKHNSTHPSLLPGTFTVFCPHGICYGFEVMECCESPDRPFTFLKTRFKEPPEVVIYDNACNLHSYCLNRDPNFFSKTKFYVDGLHWDGHIYCSIAYKALLYPEIAGNVNTQIVEQNNAKLKKLRPSLSYMKSENFMSMLKFFLWYCNCKS